MRREEGSETYGYERFISTDNIRVVHDFLKIVITAPPTNLPFFLSEQKYHKFSKYSIPSKKLQIQTE